MARALHGPNVPQALGIMIPPGLASHSSNQERFPSSLEMQAQLLDVGTERREGIRGRGGGQGAGTRSATPSASTVWAQGGAGHPAPSAESPLPPTRPASLPIPPPARPTGNDGAYGGSADVGGSRPLPVARVTLGEGHGAQAEPPGPRGTHHPLTLRILG